MNRRQFFEFARKVTLSILMADVLSEPNQTAVMGVDIAAVGADTTLVGLHPITAAADDDLMQALLHTFSRAIIEDAVHIDYDEYFWVEEHGFLETKETSAI